MRFSRITLTAILIMLGGMLDSSAAQDPVQSGRTELESADFPWYDSTMNEGRTIDLRPEKRAASLNRSKVPPHIPPPQKNPNNSNWFSNLFSGWFQGNFMGISIFSWILIFIGAIVVFGLFAWAASKMELFQRKPDEEEVEEEQSQAERIKELPFQVPTQKGDLRQQARDAFDAGDYRTAMTLLFSYVLLALDRQKLIRLRRGKTNRQYLRELRAHRKLSDFYKQVMIPFEESFFGDHLLEKRVFETCWAQLDVFQENVNQSSQIVPE